MTLEVYAGTRVPALLARAQAELGGNAIVVNIHRSRLPNGMSHFELTAADDVSAVALVSGGETDRKEYRHDPRRLEEPRNGPRIIAMVGPTGSGKTTTLAKLALNPMAFGGRKVGILSLDTHRAGSVEQLAFFSRAAGIRMETVFQPKEVGRAMRRLRKCEIILVDTPGRGPAKQRDTAAVAAILHELPHHEVHLVLPEGMRSFHAKRLIAEYEWLGVTHLLGTKLDEYPGERRVEALAREKGLPVRWMSMGQDVPNDLMTVNEGFACESETDRGTTHQGATAA